MEITRRGFFKVTASSIGASSIVAMGFSPAEALAQVREFKLARTSEK